MYPGKVGPQFIFGKVVAVLVGLVLWNGNLTAFINARRITLAVGILSQRESTLPLKRSVCFKTCHMH